MRRVGVLVVLALGCLPGCEARQGGVEKGHTAPSRQVENASVTAPKQAEPAEPVTVARQRLVATLTRYSQPFFAVREGGAAPSLRAQVGKPVSLQLALPGITRWQDATLGELVARRPGTVESLSVDKGGLVTYAFPTAGPAMLMMCAGPKDGEGARDWAQAAYCSKAIVNVTGKVADPFSDSHITNTAGQPIEVVPQVSPVGMKVGSELPTTFYFQTIKQIGVEVAARRPDGTLDHQTTDGAGVARFVLSQPGRWIIRFVKPQPDGERTAELVFDLGEGT
jgi:Domain of unknown function (DUF4198)